MGGTDFNQFIGLRNQLVKAADKFVREESLSPVLIPTISKDKDEQVNLAHKVVDVVDRANRKIWVALLRYNVDNPERSYAQVRLFARKTEDEKFQQVVYVNYKFQEFIYLVDLMNSLYDKVISNQIICNVLKKTKLICLPFIIFCLIKSRKVRTLEIIETFFSSWNQK